MAAISSTDIYNTPEAPLAESSPDYKPSVFSINGRLGVLKYMAHSMVLMLAMMALFAVAALVSGVSLTGDPTPHLSPAIILAFGICMLPAVWIGFTMFAKRLHDLNLSAWYMLAGLIPVLGSLFSLFVVFAPGMQEGNRFGGLARTATWEKVLGVIGLVFFVGAMLASIAAIAAPFLIG